ncbi:type II toxin-antitoxin system RelE/ParE family toxin [Burkholderia sp. WP9]
MPAHVDRGDVGIPFSCNTIQNYIVFYRASDEVVTILRVKHGRQQWP